MGVVDGRTASGMSARPEVNPGALTDRTAVKGEQEGTRALFAGAYAVLRNPSGHREVNYDDVAEGPEAVVLAGLLRRILDRIEKRLQT